MPVISPRPIVAVATMAVAVIGFAAGASAHVDPDPPNVTVGAPVTVGFLVEHGCDDSATIGVAIRMPEGVTEARPLDKAGWLAAMEDNVAMFVGGPLAATEEDTFSVSFIAPPVAGPLFFPVVQSCEVGEIVWAEIAEPGQPEPETPPAVIEVTAAGSASRAAPATTTATRSAATTRRSRRDLLIGATVGTTITAAISVALNRRPR